MKNMRKLVPAFAMLMVAAIMMSTASFAWFSMSTTATVTGMQVSAQAASSMIISNTKTNSGAGDVYFADRKITVDFAGTVGTLTPATWKDSKLQYPSNPATDVDVNTGKLASGAAMSDAQAGTHYIDFEMYLASAGEATQAGTLTVAFNDFNAVTKDIHKALSIQVLYKENKADTTLDPVGIVQVASIGTTNKVEITNLVIPAAFTQDDKGAYTETTNDYVTVVFRVYFDGDLESNVAGKNYVRNGTMDTTGITFGASYSFTNP